MLKWITSSKWDLNQVGELNWLEEHLTLLTAHGNQRLRSVTVLRFRSECEARPKRLGPLSGLSPVLTVYIGSEPSVLDVY